MPLPFVIKPMMSSPGTGLQHLATLIRRLSDPLTVIPGVPELDSCFIGFFFIISSAFFSFQVFE